MTDDGKDSGRAKGEISQADRDAIRNRASELGKRLDDVKAARASHASPGSANAEKGQQMGKALRMSAELISGIAVGAGIGWLLDRALGTWPWLFIVFFLLGAAAGMLNVVRAGMGIKTGPANPKAGPKAADDEDDER